MEWIEPYLDPEIMGARRGRETLDSFIQLALSAEESLLTDAPLCAIMMDMQKSFDRVSRRMIFDTLNDLGADPTIVRTLET